MRPALELAAFTLRDGAEAAMLAERPAMIEALRRAFPGVRRRHGSGTSPGRTVCSTSTSSISGCSD
jgi:hypothetical protein